MSESSPQDTGRPPVETATETVELRLRPPVHRIERRAMWWWMLRSAATVIPAVGVLAVASVMADGARTWLWPIAAVVGAVGLLHTAVVPLWRFAVHRWEAGDEAVYARTGWFVQEWRVAPISRIQTVDTSRGPIEQVMGLATLVVTTASSRGAINIPGLDHAEARRAAALLTSVTQRTPGDQT